MARMASSAKGGYYATPPEMAELICQRIYCEEGSTLHILDTCAGKGDVLLQFKEHLLNQGAEKILAYGNELERGRMEESSQKLDCVVHGGYEVLRTTPSFNFLWGNPPYEVGGLERMELTFLRMHTLRNEKRMLQENAVVSLCIPQHVLDDVAPVVAQRLSDVSVYRFTDEHYPVFKQVVVFGYFKEPPKKKQKLVRRWLRKVAEMGAGALKPLDCKGGKKYKVLSATEEIGYFRGNALKPEELLADLKNSSVFKEVQEMWMPSSLKDAKLKRPILPLKPTHLATAIAAGAVDGHLGDFVIEAHTQIEMKKETVDSPDGKSKQEITVKSPVTITDVYVPRDKKIYELK